MLLVNVGCLQWRQGRRARNEAFFHYWVKNEPALDGGIFINNLNMRPSGAADVVSTVHSAVEGGKPVAVLQPEPWRNSAVQAREAAAIFCDRLESTWLADRDYALLMNSPYAFSTEVSKRLAPRARTRVFDVADDFTVWTNSYGLADNTRTLLALADKVIFVNEATRAKLHQEPSRVFHNGCDLENYRRPPRALHAPPFWPKPEGTRYVGYIGSLFRSRMDFALLDHVLAELRDATFLFVGYAPDPTIVTRLQTHPNAHFVEAVAPEVLPDVVRSFDVAIVPHSINPVTDGNDLLKVLDYLAAGVPIVSTPCSGVARYGDLVGIATSPEEFTSRLRAALSTTAAHNPGPGYGMAAEMAWEPRLRALGSWVFESEIDQERRAQE